MMILYIYCIMLLFTHRDRWIPASTIRNGDCWS